MARLAEPRHGLVKRATLLEAGLSRDQIGERVRKGLLIPEYRGVYRVGHRAPSTEATYLAALLACGPGALLCGAAAAHLWGLIKGAPPPPEVIAPTQRRVPGLSTKRSRVPAEATTLSRIPITTVPRTLVDLAGRLSADDLARACHEAGVRYRTTPAQVKKVLARRGTTPGAARLRAVLTGETKVTLSKLEKRFLQLLREHRLPLPVTNRPAGGRRVDCRWPEHRLTVELDSYTFHNSRHSWEQGYRREREARARGDEFRRYTWGDVFEHPRLMLRELRGLLPAA